MFYNQPLSLRFGTELLKHIDHSAGIEAYWDSLDIAVAWVRASGVVYLHDSFARFLQHGGELTFIVGIDLHNTTREGLQALLDLEPHGACETFVYHNEAGSVFHPKVYLFRNEEEARLIVGSNNLTASGLYSNVEAGLLLDASIGDGVISDTLDALASWRDVSTHLAVRLDKAFLDSLYDEGYVMKEAAARTTTRSKPTGGSSTKKLFGSRRYTAPPRPGGAPKSPAKVAKTPPATPAPPATGTPVATGSTVLMRLRKSRGTQTQMPFRVANTFFKGQTTVHSAHSGAPRQLHPARAHGKNNTIKLEIPEQLGFADTYARFEKTPAGIVYEVYDIGTPKGNQIKASLDAGFTSGATLMSTSRKDNSTWWRYI